MKYGLLFALPFLLLCVGILPTAHGASITETYTNKSYSNSVSITAFSTGNINHTNTGYVNAGFAAMTGGTYFVQNANGTYNSYTITQSGSSNGSGGGSQSSYGEASYGYGQGSYESGCGSGKGQSPCPPYSQGGYYAQTGYYTQGAYYGQNTYYSQLAYYSQSAYITGMSINANPQTVRQEESSTITWNGGNSASCTVTGPGLNSNQIVGSQVVSNIVSESIYTLTCTLGPRTETATTSVKVLPRYQET